GRLDSAQPQSRHARGAGGNERPESQQFPSPSRRGCEPVSRPVPRHSEEKTMKTIRSLSAILALAGLFSVLVTGAAVADESGKANCRQETKRVAVWPRTAPKAPQMARFENRVVTVCDNKVAAAKRPADEQLQARESGN